MKFLRAKDDPKAKIRVLMRRDKTLKVCANHYSTLCETEKIFCLTLIISVNADMELKPNVGSDRSWVYFTPADFADAEDDSSTHKPETLAVRFQTVESKLIHVAQRLRQY